MAMPLTRIGKGLVKWFKPIKVALPHDPNSKSRPQSQADSFPGKKDGQPSPEDLKKNFQLFKFKKGTGQSTSSEDDLLSSSGANLPAESLPPMPDKAQWIDLVVYLLSACKRVSEKMRRKTGINVYQSALRTKSKDKIQTLGSIIDIKQEISSKKKEEKPLQKRSIFSKKISA